MFSITIGLDEGSTLCPYLYALVIVNSSKHIRDEVLYVPYL